MSKSPSPRKKEGDKDRYIVAQPGSIASDIAIALQAYKDKLRIEVQKEKDFWPPNSHAARALKSVLKLLDEGV